MELDKAKLIAEEAKAKLLPYCERIEIAGSIRRKKPFVHDIDMVCIPSNQGQFIRQLQEMGKIEMGGQKLIRCSLSEISLDIYIATSETWATLLLIRTGSARHNIMLCSRAKRLGMKLHADGTGITKYGENLATIQSEQDIYSTLSMKFEEPEQRD